MGRVCYHPCETSCNRAQLDETVGIHGVERFLGDEAIRCGWRLTAEAEPTGKRVLVVGAGPSGLSAAYHLTRRGHAVTIREAGPMAGGMMRFGIPTYRLPRDILDAEVQRILDLGVTLELNSKVTDILEAMREGGFDAAFLAVGAHIGKRAYIPAGEAAHILDAVTLLAQHGGRGAPHARPPRRRLRRREHGDGCRAHGQAPRCERGDRRLPAHARAHARARLRGRGGARRGRDDEVALDDQAGGRGQAAAGEDGARRDRLPAADGRDRGARRPTPCARARPGSRPVAARRRARP